MSEERAMLDCGSKLPAVLLALAALACAVPALLVRMPPILDYPNHYVRMWLLGGAIGVAPSRRCSSSTGAAPGPTSPSTSAPGWA